MPKQKFPSQAMQCSGNFCLIYWLANAKFARSCQVWLHISTRCPQLHVPADLHHTHPFNGPLSGTTQVSRYQKGKTNLDFTEARDSEWQWHQLSHMQVCTSLQTDNHASTPPLSFLQAGCPSCRQMS